MTFIIEITTTTAIISKQLQIIYTFASRLSISTDAVCIRSDEKLLGVHTTLIGASSSSKELIKY